jgi:hypothetical protein
MWYYLSISPSVGPQKSQDSARFSGGRRFVSRAITSISDTTDALECFVSSPND